MRKLKALSLALGLLLAVFCLPQTALAYDPIPDLNARCSLTLTCRYAGVQYELYRVCDVDAAANFTPAGKFEERASTIQRLIEKRDWTGLTSTLTTFLDAWEADGKGLAPYAARTSSTDGKAVFADLPVGLYLVVGRQCEVEPGKYYIPTNFMVCLPNWEKSGAPGAAANDGDWVYDVEVINKGTEREGETITLHALKIWRDGGNPNPPASVTVELLRRERGTNRWFEPYERVVLNSRNNFSTIWSKLDNVKYEWTVREVDVPGDYDVSYSRDGANIVITNTYDPDIPKNDPDPDPPGPDGPRDPDPNNPRDPDPNDPWDPGRPVDPNNPWDPDSPDLPDGPPNIPGEDIDDPDPPLAKPPAEEEEIEEWEPEDEEDIDDPDTPLARLPQTGVLWWPVPFLAMGGLLLFVLGWALNRREHEE